MLKSSSRPLIKKLASAAALALALALCGCSLLKAPTRVGPVMELVPELPDHCGATPLQPLVGQPFTTLAGQPDLAELRVIWPEQEVTSELRGKRINVMVDNGGRILRLFCG